MSQSLILYRISDQTIGHIETFTPKKAKDFIILSGTFTGLEFLLSKGQNNNEKELITAIFKPKLTTIETNLDMITNDDYFDIFESKNLISCISLENISKFNIFLTQLSEESISIKFDADELNRNNIYPEVWHNNNSIENAFNKTHILNDFKALKTIFKNADLENDFILMSYEL